MKVQADDLSGVYEVNDFEVEESPEDLFYDALSDDDGLIWATTLSEKMVARVESEYGITRL